MAWRSRISLLYAQVLKMDATNDKRDALHRAVQRKCPSPLSLFKKYYTKESTCFFDMEGFLHLVLKKARTIKGSTLHTYLVQ